MNMLTKEFTDAIEAKFSTLHKDVQDALKQAGVAKEMVADLVQKAAEGGIGGGHSAEPTWGDQFTEKSGVALMDLHGKSSGRVDLRMKASLTSLTTDAAGSMGGLVVPQRDSLLMLPKRRLTIRNLLSVVNVSSNSVEYPKVKARTNNAAPVAEGATKPQSDLQISLETTSVIVIAHWMKASKQILEDAPQLKALIDTELLYGLALVEEAQLLSGDGTGQNLKGMIPQATAYSPSISPADINEIDVISLAILQCSLTNVIPDGIIMHPASWWGMRMLKDANGKYILGDPQSPVAPNLFGLPVVTTEAMTAGKFLVGAFRAQTLYDRWEARVESAYANDDFIRNMITVLGEERVGFAAKSPEALIYGDFTTALAA